MNKRAVLASAFFKLDRYYFIFNVIIALLILFAIVPII